MQAKYSNYLGLLTVSNRIRFHQLVFRYVGKTGTLAVEYLEDHGT